MQYCVFFFNDTATTEIYTLSLHDALPISKTMTGTGSAPAKTTSMASITRESSPPEAPRWTGLGGAPGCGASSRATSSTRSEEHTSELQSRQYLVCRLLLEKKKKLVHTSHQ